MAQHPSKPPPQEDDPQGYWEERAQQNATKVYRYSQRKAQLVTRWFGRATREMDKRIVGFYKQYAEKEQLTLPQAKISLADRKVLELTLESAQALSELYPEDAAIRQLLDKVYFARAISRQEFLKLQLNTLASQLYGDYSGELHRTLTEVFEESYYKSRFDLQQFVGFGSAFNRISTHQIEAAVTTAWKGKNYSERLWGDHRATLARYLNRIVTNGFIEGSSGGMMRAELQKAMSMCAYEARRLIRTESCQVSNRANLLAYQENGTEQFQFLATLDMKTSELCREMDGKTFLVADGKPGINLPPLHPFCRSTTVPYLPNAKFDSEDTRTARNPTGEVYTVPADMTYRQWHDRYVSGNPVQQLAEQKFRHGRADAAQYGKYTAILGKDAPKTFDDFQNIKYTDINGWNDLKDFVSYTRKYPDSSRRYYEIDKDIQHLKLQGLLPRSTGMAVAPKPITLESYDTHALQRMAERNFGTEDASHYIQTAVVELRQFRGTRSAFYSPDGVTVVVRATGHMVTGWSRLDYNKESTLILEVSKKHG